MGLLGKLQPHWVLLATVKDRKREDSHIIQVPGDKRVQAKRLTPYDVCVNNVRVSFQTDYDFGLPCGKEKYRVICKAADDNAQLTRAQRLELGGVVEEYGVIFSDEPGCCKFGRHIIVIQEGTKPAKSYSYQLPMALKDKVEGR